MRLGAQVQPDRRRLSNTSSINTISINTISLNTMDINQAISGSTLVGLVALVLWSVRNYVGRSMMLART